MFTVSDPVVESAVLTALDTTSGATVVQTLPLTFTANEQNQSTATASPTFVQVKKTSTITVTLLGPTGVLAHLPASHVATLPGKQFFPELISQPFHHGLVIVFTAAAIMSVTGAVVSMLRGRQYYYDEAGVPTTAVPALTVPPAPPREVIIPNEPSLTSANGDSPAVAGAADRSRQRASG